MDPAQSVVAAGPTIRVGPLAIQASRTFASLVNPKFRTLWVSLLFSFTAIQMSFVAQGLLVLVQIHG